MSYCFPEPLLALLRHPVWGPETKLNDIEFLIVDFETSGLDSRNDAILSMGWVVLKHGQLHIDSARRVEICAADQIKAETAAINQINPAALNHGVPINQAMQLLLNNMKNRVLIAHSATIERGFIQQYCQREWGISSLPLVWLDTLHLEMSLLKRRPWNQQSDYRLSVIRADYGLPDYPAHDALIDAVATGELFLAQLKYIFGGETPSLGPIYRRSFLGRERF